MDSLLTSPAAPFSNASEFRKRISTATVAVCTRNPRALLQKCLAAVSRLNPGPKEILVIDNSVGNSDTRKVAQDYCACYVVEPLLGLTCARNRALMECKTDIIAFLDDNVTPSPDWLKLLVEPFSDQRVAASTGHVVRPDSLPCDPKRQGPRILSNQDPHWFETAAFAEIGGSIALRKNACTPGTIFDGRLNQPGTFGICDESYALASILYQGHKVAHTPSAIVHHPASHQDGKERGTRRLLPYWLLLFREFPRQRLALLRFLAGRLFGRKTHGPQQETSEGPQAAGIRSQTVLFKFPCAER